MRIHRDTRTALGSPGPNTHRELRVDPHSDIEPLEFVGDTNSSESRCTPCIAGVIRVSETNRSQQRCNCKGRREKEYEAEFPMHGKKRASPTPPAITPPLLPVPLSHGTRRVTRMPRQGHSTNSGGNCQSRLEVWPPRTVPGTVPGTVPAA